jgi:hypothetical protein
MPSRAGAAGDGRSSKQSKPSEPSRSSDQSKPSKPSKPSKKEQILALFRSGLGDVDDVALITRSRPSYVASVLQSEGEMSGYFDLYTASSEPMNVYSKFFAGKLGFKTVEDARASVEIVDRLYRQFEIAGDRAGQHHALVMALTMFDRARWTNKWDEADVFGRWLAERIAEAAPENASE